MTADALVQLMVAEAACELRGEYLPPLGYGNEEGIVMVDAEGTVFTAQEVAHHIARPRHLVCHGVAPVALIPAC